MLMIMLMPLVTRRMLAGENENAEDCEVRTARWLTIDLSHIKSSGQPNLHATDILNR